MIKIVREHFESFMPWKRQRKEETREELSRQTPLFPYYTSNPIENDGGEQ